MLSVIIEQKVFNYLVYEESNPDVKIFECVRKEYLIKRDLTLIYDRKGELCYTILKPRFYELEYNIFDSGNTLYATIEPKSGRNIMTIGSSVYEVEVGSFFGTKRPDLIKDKNVIGTYESIELSNSVSKYRFTGVDLNDLKSIVVMFIATHSWGI